MLKRLVVQNQNPVQTLNTFLTDLLQHGKVSAILAPMRVPSGDSVFPALVSAPEKMNADLLAPVLPVSTAQIVSRLTWEAPVSSPIAVIMRNCEIRAIVELVKLKQADLKNLFIIGIDCPGTLCVGAFKKLSHLKTSYELCMALLNNDNQIKSEIRSACSTCLEPIPQRCDISIDLYGADSGSEILIEIHSDAGKILLESSALQDCSDSKNREKTVNTLIKLRAEADKKFRETYDTIKGIDEILMFYASCINCQNCRRVCPICYCQECFFSSDNLSQTADNLVRKSRARGAFKMPMDTLLFHTGRMNHMILSCVECGLCEQACPMDIPLMQVIKRVASVAQAMFDYRAGRNLEDDIPLTQFKESEFTDVGEK